jgi:hypothetical protein
MPNPPAQPPYAPFAAFLSYLVPGLGQIYQGRIAKGILFLVCIYGLFFYGMALGKWSNVYLPDSADLNRNTGFPRVLVNLYNRPQFLGQFWMGVAVWPAVWQYMVYDPKLPAGPMFGTWQRTPYEWSRQSWKDPTTPSTPEPPEGWKGQTLNEMQTDSDKTWDLAWVYTVIAGVLNVMVIYDAYAGPAFTAAATAHTRETRGEHAATASVAG